MNPPEKPNPNARKLVKGNGVDSGLSRKARAESSVQIRKDKRVDRANIERRKLRKDDTEDALDMVEEEAATKGPFPKNLKILPAKVDMLLSGVLEQEVQGVTYFRRILAVDKHPPLDIVMEHPMIVPTLIRFLSRTDSMQLQLEAAWSITNIACGERRHVTCLLEHGALNELVRIVETTPHANLKEQVVWAICNISSDETGCHYLLTNLPHFFTPLLNSIGINCVRLNSAFVSPTPSGTTLAASTPPFTPFSTSSFTQSQDVVNDGADSLLQPCEHVPDRIANRNYPSLSLMRYVAFTLSNLARLKSAPNLRICVLKIIVFAFADLMQSPDDMVGLDICSSLISLCQIEGMCAHGFSVIDIILSNGLLGKMKELMDTRPNLSASHPSNQLSGKGKEADSPTKSDEVCTLQEISLLVVCAVVNNAQISIQILTAVSNPPPLGRYHTLSQMVVQLANTDSNMSRHDICSALAVLFKLDVCGVDACGRTRGSHYARHCFESCPPQGGIIPVLLHTIQVGSHQAKEDASCCLCTLITSETPIPSNLNIISSVYTLMSWNLAEQIITMFCILLQPVAVGQYTSLGPELVFNCIKAITRLHLSLSHSSVPAGASTAIPSESVFGSQGYMALGTTYDFSSNSNGGSRRGRVTAPLSIIALGGSLGDLMSNLVLYPHEEVGKAAAEGETVVKEYYSSIS